MKFVTLGPDDRAAAFYDPSVNAIPEGAIPISDALWAEWIDQTPTVVYDAATQSLKAYIPQPPSQAALGAQLAAAASAASAALVAQAFPDAAHHAAFQNAASIVNGAGGAAPTIEPLASKFAALAAANGMSASAFATLVVAMQGASLDLSTALGALCAAIAAPQFATDLMAALAAFEAALATIVAEINAAAPPQTIVAPAPISIPGINAAWPPSA